MSEIQYQPTIDDMINLPSPGSAQIAPDGRHVAYLVSKPDWEQNERITHSGWQAKACRATQITFARHPARSALVAGMAAAAFLSQREAIQPRKSTAISLWWRSTALTQVRRGNRRLPLCAEMENRLNSP